MMSRDVAAQSLLLSQALLEAGIVTRILSGCPAVIRVEVAGAARRKCDLVERIPMIGVCSDFREAIAHISRAAGVDRVSRTGDAEVVLTMSSGIQVDLYLADEPAFPYLLFHLTGSVRHVAAMQERALRLGIRMTRAGMLRCGQDVPAGEEADIFRALELDFIPPELREGTGEIEAAEHGRLPALVERRDLRGLFHVHSDWSDGTDSLEDLVRQALAEGYEYIGISDHSRSAYYAGGLQASEVSKQHAEIDRLQDKYGGIRILKGIESDILADGSLDYDSATLECCDFVIGSIHSGLGMDEAAATRRVIRAMENPWLTMLGHPTGRLLLEFPPCPLDLHKIVDAARAHGVAIEINSNPKRLDLDWHMARYAGDRGVPVSINPDAHSAAELGDVSYGVGIARKAWLTPDQVLNARTLPDILAFLGSRIGGRKSGGRPCRPASPQLAAPIAPGGSE